MKRLSKQKGFTLLEMLVSLGIFTVVAVIAVGALVRIVGLNRQAQTLQSSMNNLSFALEAMSREMRVGTQHTCVANVDDVDFWNGSSPAGTDLSMETCNVYSSYTGRMIVFASTELDPTKKCNLIYAYRFKASGQNKWRLEKAQQTECGENADFYSILDDSNITLTKYQLGIYRATANYPWTFIRLVGYAGQREQDKNFFDVQTSVEGRIAD